MQLAPPNSDAYLSIRVVTARTGLSRTTIWRAERAGLFPHRRQLTPGRVAWLASEVDAWIAARVEVSAIALAGPREPGSPAGA